MNAIINVPGQTNALSKKLMNVLKKTISIYKKMGAEMLLLSVFRYPGWLKAIFSYSRQEILLASSMKLLLNRLLDNDYEVKEAGEGDINTFIDLSR